MSDTRASDSLQRGIETAKAGNKLLARLHLLQAVELAPRDPNCWLWLAWVSESPSSTIQSLERVLEEHPNHELALLGMRWASAMAEYEYQDYSHISQEPQETQVAEPGESRDDWESDPEDAFAETAQDENFFEESNEVSGEPSADWEESESDLDTPNAEVGPDSDTIPSRREDLEAWDADEVAQEEAQENGGEEDFSEAQDESSFDAELSNEPESNFEDNQFAQGMDDEQNNEDDSRFAESSQTDNEPEAVESNASDETLAESNWWRQTDNTNDEIAEESSPWSGSSEESTVEINREEEAETEQELVAESWNDSEPEDVDSSDGSTITPVPEELVIATVHEEAPAAIEEVFQEEAAAEEDFVAEADEDNEDFGVTVLVVDDSPTVRKLVTMTLEKNGFTVGSAPDGVVALKSIAELKPRLILLDITMPRLGGYQLCKLIKKHESTKHIPVIMLSGKDGMFDKVRGKFVGCDDYITKPFDPDVLVEKVSTQLTEHYGIAATRS